MKKFISMTAAVLMTVSLAACSSSSSSTAAKSSASSSAETPAASESAEAETASAKYTITNNTGDTVTELYVYKDGDDKGDNYAGENGLADGEKVTVDKGEQDSSDNFTLEYITEGGRDEKFTTLHIEEANISLLAEDAMTGSTPLEFVTE